MGRIEHRKPIRCDLVLGWCTCKYPKCSTIWWCDHGQRRQFDGCQRRKRRRERPKYVINYKIQVTWFVKKEKWLTLVWPMNLLVVLPEARSQSLRVPSHEPERQNCPSDEMTTSETKWECPFNLLFGIPYWLNENYYDKVLKELKWILKR